MSFSLRSLSTTFALTAIALLLAVVPAQPQTQASCTFTHFQLSSENSNFPTTTPYGVNDFGTVVGQASFQTGAVKGFIRYANGAVTYYRAWNVPPSLTSLVGRNDNGINIGNVNGSTGFILSGSTFTAIDLGTGHNYPFPTGINNWNSIVGYYQDTRGDIHGFKRWSNGSFLSFDYPGASTFGAFGTQPAGINDSGITVGIYYLPPSDVAHGFIYKNGQFATLDYPNASGGTMLKGISNAGVIVGNAQLTPDHQTPFLYEHGEFKVISDPNAPADSSTTVTGISPKRGIITGAYPSLSTLKSEGFTATCD
jgi:hypothetical protein